MMILFSINLTMSMIFISLSHPLSMGLILLMQTIVVSLITGNFTYNYWFSYILFLIMVGGMLILFMYMTSIASNEKFKFNMKYMYVMVILPIAVMIMLPSLDLDMMNNETTTLEMNTTIMSSVNKYINNPSTTLMIIMITYLLLALVAAVKISQSKHGPLRQMN